MLRTLTFTGIGYLSGGILFARLFGHLLKNKDITFESPDGNPGTFNAFRYGGFLCGVLTLFGDLLKGFLPVFLYLRTGTAPEGVGLAFVLAAPVFGHILPVFHKFQGGKGIAVSFGCLLGLLPEYRPVVILAFFFLFFSLIMKVTPNYHKTLFTYLFSVIGMGVFVPNMSISFGFMLIAGLIMLKLLFSSEKRISAGWRYYGSIDYVLRHRRRT